MKLEGIKKSLNVLVRIHQKCHADFHFYLVCFSNSLDLQCRLD